MRLRDFLCIAVLTCAVTGSAANPSYTVLHRFVDGKFSARPLAPLIADGAGNFYGTASAGGNGGCVRYGSTGCGTVFELTRSSAPGGPWTENVLFRFAGGSKPWWPMAGLTMDAAGNFFGTTTDSPYGAPDSCVPGDYCGSAFQLTPPSKPLGAWTETDLYRFNPDTDGVPSFSGLVPDDKGNLYGTTCTGGPNFNGTVFQLTPPPKAGSWWTKTSLIGFHRDESCPSGNVVFDGAGNLYGTTFYGGSQNLGLVFMLTPPAKPGAHWTKTVLFEFGSNTCFPQTNPIFDGSSNLYGTARGCPAFPGAVFRLTPPRQPGGSWTETVLVTFEGSNGDSPTAGLIFDDAGNLYGTTENGGAYGHGTIFQLKPPAGNDAGETTGWTETILHSFNEGGGDVPWVGPIFGMGGALYGTTSDGGYRRGVCKVAGCGAVFKVAP